MEEFVVYILSSTKTDKLYKGFTSNLIARMQSHNHLGRGWTKRYRPWEVIHIEFFASKTEALAREKWFKSTTGRRWLQQKLF